MFNEFLGAELLLIFAQDAAEDETIEHVFVSDVDVFFYLPGFTLAVGASIVSICDDLVVSVAEDAFTLITLFGVVERNAIAYGASNKFMLQE
ncbi:unnamed protein product [Sphagnum balticum]